MWNLDFYFEGFIINFYNIITKWMSESLLSVYLREFKICKA